MPRKAKEYSHWPIATMDIRPYWGGDEWPYLKIRDWLRDQGGDECFEERATYDYEYPRKQWATKKVTHVHFCIRDPKMLNYVVLKWGLTVSDSLWNQHMKRLEMPCEEA